LSSDNGSTVGKIAVAVVGGLIVVALVDLIANKFNGSLSDALKRLLGGLGGGIGKGLGDGVKGVGEGVGSLWTQAADYINGLFGLETSDDGSQNDGSKVSDYQPFSGFGPPTELSQVTYSGPGPGGLDQEIKYADGSYGIGGSW
jgi:hypothetical protein